MIIMFSIFQFQFVNSFLALFYTAFYLQDIEKLKEVRGLIRSFLEFSLNFSYWLRS